MTAPSAWKWNGWITVTLAALGAFMELSALSVWNVGATLAPAAG
jgi:hypothetical protein